jgi:hypothetical protein
MSDTYEFFGDDPELNGAIGVAALIVSPDQSRYENLEAGLRAHPKRLE